MVLILGVVIYASPQILKGKSIDEVMSTMLHFVIGFAFFGGAVTVIGLIVWLKVLKGKKKREDF